VIALKPSYLHLRYGGCDVRLFLKCGCHFRYLSDRHSDNNRGLADAVRDLLWRPSKQEVSYLTVVRYDRLFSCCHAILSTFVTVVVVCCYQAVDGLFRVIINYRPFRHSAIS